MQAQKSQVSTGVLKVQDCRWRQGLTGGLIYSIQKCGATTLPSSKCERAVPVHGPQTFRLSHSSVLKACYMVLKVKNLLLYYTRSGGSEGFIMLECCCISSELKHILSSGPWQGSRRTPAKGVRDSFWKRKAAMLVTGLPFFTRMWLPRPKFLLWVVKLLRPLYRGKVLWLTT